jgi:hypothetical protein
MITLYKVIFKTDADGVDRVHDIRPIQLISDNDLININDYKSIKELATLLKMDYKHTAKKVIHNKDGLLNLDNIFNNIDKYLLNNQYIIIKDYI